MIDFKRAKRYCKEDLCLIENYENALNDANITWDVHHRLETDENISQDELMKNDLYFHRPAKELIFLTPSEHHHLHSSKEKNPMYGRYNENHPCYGRIISDEENEKRSKSLKEYYKDTENRKRSGNIRRGVILTKEHKQLLSDINKGARRMTNGIERRYILKDQIEYYLKNGYRFGWK